MEFKGRDRDMAGALALWGKSSDLKQKGASSYFLTVVQDVCAWTTSKNFH